MDAETRGAIDGLTQEVRSGFARMDRYFELSQAQHQQLARRVDDGFAAVDRRFERLEARMDRMESEFRSFRDWVTVRLTELRSWILDLISRVEALEQR